MGAFVVYILEWSACLLLFLLLYNISFESALEVSTDGLTVAEKGALVLLIVYLLYVLTQLVGWGKAYVKMLWFLRGKRRHRLSRWIWLVEHDSEYGPFSWMNHIVISSHEEGFGRRASIRHELSHILLLHHIDLLLTVICVIINPVCWLVMKEIKIVHEYEADDEVINHYRIQSRDYQRLLILPTIHHILVQFVPEICRFLGLIVPLHANMRQTEKNNLNEKS